MDVRAECSERRQERIISPAIGAFANVIAFIADGPLQRPCDGLPPRLYLQNSSRAVANTVNVRTIPSTANLRCQPH